MSKSKNKCPKPFTSQKNNFLDFQNKFFEDNLYKLKNSDQALMKNKKGQKEFQKKLSIQLPPRVPYNLKESKKDKLKPRKSILVNSPLKLSSQTEIESDPKRNIKKSKTTLVQNFVRRDSFGNMITKGGKQQIQFEDLKNQKNEKKSAKKCCCIIF